MELKFSAMSSNESFARVCAGAFATQLDPTLEQIADIKTAVSEAVTNAIVHGYRNENGDVYLRGTIDGNVLTIEVQDYGCGIADIEKAREPLYTTVQDEERSGMGFTVMETFMDSLEVESEIGKGTKLIMTKIIAQESPHGSK